MTNVAEKPYPFGAAHTHIAHISELSPGITSLVLFLNQILDWVPSSFTFQWLFKLCLHLYHPYTDWCL